MSNHPTPKLQEIIDLEKQGYRATAVRRLRDYLRQNPKDAEAWYYLARFQVEPADQKLAIDNALKLRPDYPEAIEFQSVLFQEYPYLQRSKRRLWFALTVSLLLAVVAAGVVFMMVQEEPKEEVIVVVPTTQVPTPITPTFIIVTNTPEVELAPPTLDVPTLTPTETLSGVIIVSPEATTLPTLEAEATETEIAEVPDVQTERLLMTPLLGDSEDVAASLADELGFEFLETSISNSAEAAALLESENVLLVVYGSREGDTLLLQAYGSDRDGGFRHRANLRYLSRLDSPFQITLELPASDTADAAPLRAIADYLTFDHQGVIENLSPLFVSPPMVMDETQSQLAFMLAYSYQAVGRADDALRLYDILLTATTDPDPLIAANRAYVIAQTGDQQSGITLLLNLVGQHPDPVLIQTMIADIYMQTPEGWEAAQLTLDEAARQYPNDPRPYVARGRLFIQRNEFNRALEDFGKAIQVDPSYVLAYTERAQLRRQMGLLDEALQDVDLAITFQPQLGDLYGLRGQILNSLNEWQDASTAFERAIQYGVVNPDTYAGLAEAYFEVGNLDGTIRESNNALELDQDHAGAWLQRGRAYLAQNLPQEALNDFNQGLAREAENVALLVARCATHARLGDDGAAATDCDSALALDNDNGFALEQRGMIRARAGDRAGAAEDFAEAISYEPTAYEAHYYLGLYALQERRYNDAIRSLGRSIELAPFLGKAYAARGVAYRIGGEWQLAIDDLQQALNLVPEDIYSYYELGLAQRFLADQTFEGGDPAGAYTLYEAAAESLLNFLNASQPEDQFVPEARAALGYVQDALNAIRESPS